MVTRNKGHKGLIVHSLFSGSTDPAFMARGFRNWKKSSECFLDYQNSKIHKDKECLDHGDVVLYYYIFSIMSPCVD